jgi:hypothetical protein
MLLFPSASNPNVMPPLEKPGPQGNSEDVGPQVSVAEAAHQFSDPILETVPAMDRAVVDSATTTTGAAAEASSSRPQTEAEAFSPDGRDDLKVVLGCPCDVHTPRQHV